MREEKPVDILKHSNKMIEVGDYQKAHDMISAAQLEMPDNYHLQIQNAYLKVCMGKYEDGIAEIRDIIKIMPRVIFGHKKLIEILFEHNKLDAALDAAISALDIRPNSKPILNLLARIYEKMDKYSEALKIWEKQLKSEKSNNIVLGVLKGCLHTGETKKGIRVYKDFCATTDDIPNSIKRIGIRLLRRSEDNTEAIEKISIELEKNIDAKKKFKYGNILLSYGALDKAIDAYKDIVSDPEVGRSVLHFLKIAKLLKKNINDRSLPSIQARDKGVIYYRKPESTKALLLFNGQDQSVGNVPINVFQHFIEGLDINVIYLIDIQRAFYMKGVPELGSNYEETIASLKSILKDMNVSDVYCLGTSGGGYAATIYSLDLQARAALTFSTPANFKEDFRINDSRVGKNIMMRLLNKIPDHLFDLTELIQGYERVPEIINYVGGENDDDLYSGRYLDTLSNVTLVEVEGATEHCVLPQLIAEEKFNGIVEDFLKI